VYDDDVDRLIRDGRSNDDAAKEDTRVLPGENVNENVSGDDVRASDNTPSPLIGRAGASSFPKFP
jgi:hypothetical protein